MFKRLSESILERFARFPAVTILGPRQSGKISLAKASFPNHQFISFDRLNDRAFAEDDPEKFFRAYDNEYGIIIDEFQYVPHIVEYVKYLIDRKKKKAGYYILTGSENYLSKGQIKESLAGRTALLTLLPLSLGELLSNGLISQETAPEETIFKGSYPRIFDEHLLPVDYYSTYAQTYIERDVKGQVQSSNLIAFRKFVTLCAARSGQILNIESMCNDLGVKGPTAAEWLSILQESYLVFLLYPYTNSFDKRISKRPKLYFWDTGLACSLLGIKSSKDVLLSPFYGALFETLIVGDLCKQYYNTGQRPSIYFWRDRTSQHEVDCIIQEAQKTIPVEIKSAETIVPDFFKGLSSWYTLTKDSLQNNGYIVYGGKQSEERSQGHVVGWQASAHLVSSLQKSEDDLVKE